jgi:hypothetical protein
MSMHTPSPFVTPIERFSDIAPDHVDSNTLILIDIDNTILASDLCYGSVEFFIHMVRDEVARSGRSLFEVKRLVAQRWVDAQAHIPTKLLDEKIHEFMERAVGQGAVVVGFTARDPAVLDLTFNQLNHHRIAFEGFEALCFAKTYEHLWEGNLHKAHAKMEKGVMFCHDMNPKGVILKDFLSNVQAWRASKELAPVSRVLLVDDWIHNLISMEEATKQSGIDFWGYHFQYEKKDFDPVRALEQERFFLDAKKKSVGT